MGLGLTLDSTKNRFHCHSACKLRWKPSLKNLEKTSPMEKRYWFLFLTVQWICSKRSSEIVNECFIFCSTVWETPEIGRRSRWFYLGARKHHLLAKASIYFSVIFRDTGVPVYHFKNAFEFIILWYCQFLHCSKINSLKKFLYINYNNSFNNYCSLVTHINSQSYNSII